jgi:hypothetical protein
MDLDNLMAPWPAEDKEGPTGKLWARLAALPGELRDSGIDVDVLKDATLPPWKDSEPVALAGLVAGLGGAADAPEVRQRLEALPLPAADPATTDDQLATALSAARALRGLGAANRAVEVLRAAARAVRLRPERTALALWLLEVVQRWLDSGTAERLRCRVLADLGSLVAQTGDITEGSGLLRKASEGLFELAAQDPEAAREAWQLRYEAVAWGLRTRTARRAQAVAELKAILAKGGAPEGSEAWFHAGLERIAAEAGPDAQAAGVADAEQLLRRLDTAGLPPETRNRIRAHAHQALGQILTFGNNASLHTRARKEWQQAAALSEAGRSWPDLAQALDALGRICSQLGDHAAADDALQKSIGLKERLKDLWGLGASLNGRASSLMRRGMALAAVPLYDANIGLLQQTPGASRGLILQNLGQKAVAYLAAYQNPLEAEGLRPAAGDLEGAAAALDRYKRLMAGQPHMEVSEAYYHMLRGALARLQARLADGGRAVRLLAEGEGSVRQAIAGFQEGRDRVALPNAEIHLAGLLTDHARLLKEDDPERDKLLDEARSTLERADGDTWDSYERAYLELEWAWYHLARGQAAEAENHIASARHQADFCGNHAIQASAGASMRVHLRGPTGQDRWEVLLPPGERLDIPVFALDWRGRPLARYALHATVVQHPGPAPVAVGLLPEGAAADRAGQASPTREAVTDPLGQATFTIWAPKGARSGTVSLEVRDHNVLREARVEVHVQPFDIVLGPGLSAGPPLEPEETIILRHLFGPRFRRVVLSKRLGGGLGGAKVLLVKPLLAPPPGLGKAPPSPEDGLKAQCCLVKIGERRQIEAEAACYERHVKDLLSPNVARLAGSTAWGGRAGMRMSLVGDQDWERALDEEEWLVGAPPMDAHHLLADMFARDLGPCWYTNGQAQEDRMPLYQVYGRQLPALLTLRAAGPGHGLLTRRPPGLRRTLISEGLRPPGPERGLEKGDEPVYVGELEITNWEQHGDEWEYELTATPGRLRVHFRTPVPPRHVDPDGVEANLLGQRQRRHAVGVVEELEFDRLLEVLRASVAAYPARRGEKIVLADNDTCLQIRTGRQKRDLPNPLIHLHGFLELPLPHKRSIIHGDLHLRNVLVSPRGMPYFIDFSEAGPGPTLFDFVKHEVALWDWTLASPPAGAPRCPLTGALQLMEELTDPQHRFPEPFTEPKYPREEGDLKDWLTKFYRCVGTVRLLARQHSVSPQQADYFAPLCLYAGRVLHWCDPRGDLGDDVKKERARRVVFLSALSGMLLARGLTGAPVPAQDDLSPVVP